MSLFDNPARFLRLADELRADVIQHAEISHQSTLVSYQLCVADDYS